MILGFVQNPYYDNSFLDFFVTLFSRIFSFITGEGGSITSDEIQLSVLSLIALSCSLIGTFLVLRKMTMLANALSHTILTGVVGAYFLYQWIVSPSVGADFSELLPSEGLLFSAAILMALITNFLTEFLIASFGLKSDASCGLVFTFLFAVGVVLVTFLSRNAHIGAELLMGNSDALHKDDLLFQAKICLGTAIVILVFWRAFFVTTFDHTFSIVAGFSSGFYNYLLLLLAAISTVGAFRAVGVLLVLAFFVIPTLVARVWTDKFIKLLLLSAGSAVVASILSVAISRHLFSVYQLAASTGSIVVVVLTLFYLLSLGVKTVSKKINLYSVG